MSLVTLKRLFHRGFIVHQTYVGSDLIACVVQAGEIMLLEKHKIHRVKTRDSLDELLRTVAAGSVRAATPIECGHGFRSGHGFKCNAMLSDMLKMCSLSCGFSATFDFEPSDVVSLVFSSQSNSRVVFDRHTIEVSPQNNNYILPAGRSVTEFHPTGYRALTVRLKPNDLKDRLNALCGADLAEPIVFEQPDAADAQFLRYVRRPLFAAAEELDEVDPLFHANLLDEIKAVTLTRMLLFAPHNFSQLLARRSSAPSRTQMKIAEDYLAANWNKALDVTGLAEAVGVSARTVLRYFHESHGETPRQYMKRIRLNRAQEMLRIGDAGVMAVALSCGFTSLGNFARSYRESFGELPSETSRRAK